MKTQPRENMLPVTAISGFLGAGKTTLLNHLIRNSDGERIAIIVNDIGEVNIDAALIEGEVRSANSAIDQILELSGGCICCSLQSDLTDAISELADNDAIDRLIIEATGVAEPMSIAQAFLMADSQGSPLEEKARIDSLVTVIDAPAFSKEWNSHVVAEGKRRLLRQSDERPVLELLVEQVECADLLILNKIDSIEKFAAEELRIIIANLNERARIHQTNYGRIEKSVLIGRNLFDPAKTIGGARWLQQLESPANEPPASQTRFSRITLETSSLSSNLQPQVVGPISKNKKAIVTLVYRARQPFDPNRFDTVINQGIHGLLRAKGYCWIKGQDDQVGFVSIAGLDTRCDFMGNWWAAALDNGRIDHSQIPKQVAKKWKEPHGDRRQELVFIGYELDRETLKNELDACLVEAG